MLKLLHLAIFLSILFNPLYGQAADLRMVPGDAIISVPFKSVQTHDFFHAKLYKIKNDAYRSLNYQELSNRAYKVSIKRKSTKKSLYSSERFLKSRNPCNAPTIKRLLRTSRGLICEPNWEGKIILTPNDTFQSQVYAANPASAARLYLPEAWNLTTGSSNVFVGVIDTGVDYTHLDLVSNIWTNSGEISSNGVDDDGNGYVDDVHGFDSYNNDGDPLDDQSHGTFVSGILGATGNNARGLAGIAWNVKIIACKAFNSSGTGTTAAIISCLNYLVNLKNNYGINIVATNNSYGGFPFSQSMRSAIDSSRAAEIVYVAGAGNNATNNDTVPFYPASYDLDNIISVGAIDSQANKTSFSNFGLSVDISAPGLGVFTTGPGNQYGTVQGTSMATPHITGAVALLMSYHPDYSYSQVVSSILDTGTSIPALSGYNLHSSILNMHAALVYSPPTPTSTPTVIPSTPTPPIIPTETPLPENPVPRSAKMKISAQNSRTKSTVSCTLSASINGKKISYEDVAVEMVIKGSKKEYRSNTNAQGAVRFVVRRQSRSPLSLRCIALISDSGESYIIRSKSVSLKFTR